MKISMPIRMTVEIFVSVYAVLFYHIFRIYRIRKNVRNLLPYSNISSISLLLSAGVIETKENGGTNWTFDAEFSES